MEAKATTTFPVRLDVIGPNGDVLHTSEFVKEKIVLGRILSADLRIDDPRVSRIHALIEVRGENVLITDLASTHGTHVNGSKVVEARLKVGDVIKLGYVEIKLLKGSGKASTGPSSVSTGLPVQGDETLVEIDRAKLDGERRERTDRRKSDAFPEEKRLQDRRDGDRRVESRKDEPREEFEPGLVTSEKQVPGADERRVGQRRRGDRRVFDITSLERRIEDRRTRKSSDELLTEDLEKAFEQPEHARELEITAMWGDHILDVSNYYHPCVLSVGESPRNEYIVPSVGIPDEFPLVTIEDDGTAYLAFTGDMQGTIRARDKMYSTADLKEEKFIKKYSDYYVLALKQDDFAKLSIGNVSFFILYVKPAPRIKAAPMMDKDPLLFRATIGSVLFLALLFFGVSLVEAPKPVTIEMIPERFAKIVIKKRPDISKLKSGIVAPGEEDKQGGSRAGEGGPPIGPEGKLGRPDLPDKKEVPQAILPKSKPKETPQIAANNNGATKQNADKPKPISQAQRKLVDEKKAKSVGLLGALSQGGVSKDLKALIDRGEGPEGQGGFDEFGKAVTGLRGKSIEEVGGAGGKGLKGVDVGGGGKTIGIDGPSTKGLGRGYKGDGIGEGISGPGRLGIKGEHAISIISENVQVLSGLPKDVINAVVQRHRAEIRACYDTALQRNPGVRGKVSVAFMIQPNGIVSSCSVKESTVGDPNLENCIVTRVRSWVFPKPEAPVVTEVAAYPFYLSPAN